MAENQWYILIGQERQGPMSVHDVRYLLSRRNIDGGTLVWQEGMDSWVRLREVEGFQPKKKEEPEEAEQAEAEQPEEPAPQPVEPGKTRNLQRILPVLLSLGLIAGALYVFIEDEVLTKPETSKAKRTVTRRQQRTPADLVEHLKQGDRGARQQLVQGGNRSVPALIQALLEKGSPLSPKAVVAILIEIGPSSASSITEALEGLDLTKAVQIILVEVLGEFNGLTTVPALIIALGSPEIEVQDLAIEAISQLDPALGPALARHLTSPIEDLSKQQKTNLAKALGLHGSPESIPTLEQASRSERDAEVIEALAKAVKQITRNPRTETPDAVARTAAPPSSDSRQENRDTAPAKNVSIHVSATATATATAESKDKEPDEEEEDEVADPSEQAKALAEEGKALMDAGNEEAALKKYKQAYALNPIRAYLIIILALEGNTDSLAAAQPDTLTPIPPLPKIEAPNEVSLSDIYGELERDEPDLGPFSGSIGKWTGSVSETYKVVRDGNQELYVVRGSSGQDFIAAVSRGETLPDDISSEREWNGTLQGFRIVEDGDESRMLPVLLIEKVE